MYMDLISFKMNPFVNLSSKTIIEATDEKFRNIQRVKVSIVMITQHARVIIEKDFERLFIGPIEDAKGIIKKFCFSPPH